MRRIRLSLCVAVALSALAYSGAQAAGLNCAVGISVNNKATIWLHHKKIAWCSGAFGCKCVSCYNLDGSVSSACHPLVAPMPPWAKS
ncbi:MAG TPA: hypothetical protein VE396_02225 [Xanthobacteraceae bacterium]|jgi:hypothetical protein|nr:hypothetical protein [Xanthobacteraceae bacterium]